jgi:menaquinone-dependent protoporphyrinogen oxidase
MKILVTASSKHGSTHEIADRIAETLREQGADVARRLPEEVSSVDEFDAVVLGSAVYAGHWLKPARELVERLGPKLEGRSVWLFSSGPLGDPPKPEEDPVDVAEVMETTKARQHRVFAGKLTKKELSFGERAIVLALRAPEGDFRDWEDIKSWAREITEELSG